MGCCGHQSLVMAKGQIEPKAEWCAVDSPKKQICFFFAFHGTQNKFVCSFFWEKLGTAMVRFFMHQTLFYSVTCKSICVHWRKVFSFNNLNCDFIPLIAQRYQNLCIILKFLIVWTVKRYFLYSKFHSRLFLPFVMELS